MSSPHSVLVVDDQAPFRAAVKAVLRRLAGFELAAEASGGLEAIRLVDELHPALVLMDINMPEMSGIEATRRIVAAHPTWRCSCSPPTTRRTCPGTPPRAGPAAT